MRDESGLVPVIVMKVFKTDRAIAEVTAPPCVPVTITRFEEINFMRLVDPATRFDEHIGVKGTAFAIVTALFRIAQT